MNSTLIIILCGVGALAAMVAVLVIRHLQHKREEARPTLKGDPITLADQISESTDDS